MTSLPNWRSATSYPTAHSYAEPYLRQDDPFYTSKAWAWQFLRRSEVYQADYRRLMPHLGSTEARSVARSYGLAIMCPYNEEMPAYIPFFATAVLPQFDSHCRQPLRTLERPHIAFVFDLRLPPEHQLELARIQFLEERARRNIESLGPRRKRHVALARYLRVIDAKRAGASNREIAQQFITDRLYASDSPGSLFAGQCRLERDWKIARQLVAHGYLGLAYSSR